MCVIGIIEPDTSSCLNGGVWDFLFDMCDCAAGYSGSRCELGILIIFVLYFEME